MASMDMRQEHDTGRVHNLLLPLVLRVIGDEILITMDLQVW